MSKSIFWNVSHATYRLHDVMWWPPFQTFFKSPTQASNPMGCEFSDRNHRGYSSLTPFKISFHLTIVLTRNFGFYIWFEWTRRYALDWHSNGLYVRLHLCSCSQISTSWIQFDENREKRWKILGPISNKRVRSQTHFGYILQPSRKRAIPVYLSCGKRSHIFIE